MAARRSLARHVPAYRGDMTDALSYFSAKLALETDPSDVYEAQQAGEPFVLVDVRGEEAWRAGTHPRCHPHALPRDRRASPA